MLAYTNVIDNQLSNCTSELNVINTDKLSADAKYQNIVEQNNNGRKHYNNCAQSYISVCVHTDIV